MKTYFVIYTKDGVTVKEYVQAGWFQIIGKYINFYITNNNKDHISMSILIEDIQYMYDLSRKDSVSVAIDKITIDGV